jgi:putative FmdB family regulatory protein
MPTYNYKCKKCEHEFEIVQRITEESLKDCPKCKGELQKVIYPSKFTLKGSGWTGRIGR